MSDDAVTKQDQDEDAEELGEGVFAVAADAGPEEVRLCLEDVGLGDLVVDQWAMLGVGDVIGDVLWLLGRFNVHGVVLGGVVGHAGG